MHNYQNTVVLFGAKSFTIVDAAQAQEELDLAAFAFAPPENLPPAISKPTYALRLFFNPEHNQA